jgi:hypothetical protein
VSGEVTSTASKEGWPGRGHGEGGVLTTPICTVINIAEHPAGLNDRRCSDFGYASSGGGKTAHLCVIRFFLHAAGPSSVGVS